ncbi:MAG TPA: CheR family methyltransferase, partial [Puia sp.]|nr:CheR family methyltransferase [Puia sp.]
LVGHAARRSSNIVREGILLEPDQVYIVPAGMNPDIRDGRFVIVHRPMRDAEGFLPDLVLAALASHFRFRLTVVLTGQAGLMGADIVRRQGGFVYFLDDPEFRPPMNAVSLIDGMVTPAGIASALASDQPRIRLSAGGAAVETVSPARANLCKLLQQEVFPLLAKEPHSHGPHRVWIAGNPEGILAFSTAIGLIEYLRVRKLGARVQLFATGLDRREVQRSRAGVFDKDGLSVLKAEWCDAYFTRRDDGLYQVSRSLQHSCIFATHHLVADPPFAHADLIICTDSLSLLTDSQRKKLFQSFHYALNPGGCLLLPDHAAATGMSLSGRFTTPDTVSGVYIRQSDPAVSEPGVYYPRPVTDAEKEAEKIILSGQVPPAMLVDEELRVIRFYGITSPYLRRNQDRPSLHLLKIVRDELVFELSDLLAKVSRTRRAAASDGIYLADQSRPECWLEVLPVPVSPGHRLVIIREKGNGGERKASRQHASQNARDKRVRSLEKQVQRLRYQLQTAHFLFRQNQQHFLDLNEHMRADIEELQSVNEEFHAINDDLQVRNKDLEQQAALNRSVISAIHRPLLVIMDNGLIRIANRAFLDLFGLDRRAIEGLPWTTAAGSMFDLPELRERLQAMEDADVVDFE